MRTSIAPVFKGATNLASDLAKVDQKKNMLFSLVMHKYMGKSEELKVGTPIVIVPRNPF